MAGLKLNLYVNEYEKKKKKKSHSMPSKDFHLGSLIRAMVGWRELTIPEDMVSSKGVYRTWAVDLGWNAGWQAIPFHNPPLVKSHFADLNDA